VINGAGWAFGTNGGHDQLNRAPAVKVSGVDHELRHVGSPDIGDKTGIFRDGVLQYSIAGIGFRREGPVKTQWLRRSGIRIEVAKGGRLADTNGNNGPGSGHYVINSGCGSRFRLRELTIARASPTSGNQHGKQDCKQPASRCTRRPLYELGRRHDLKLLIFQCFHND